MKLVSQYKKYSYAVIEDDVNNFVDIVNAINECSLPTELVIAHGTKSYEFDDYIRMLREQQPQILIIDQKLQWNDGYKNEANVIVEQLKQIYSGGLRPVLILNSLNYFSELIARYNTISKDDNYYTPGLNLFIVTTESILLKKSNTKGNPEIWEFLIKGIEFLDAQQLELPKIDTNSVVISMDTVLFYNVKALGKPINGISLLTERFISFFPYSKMHEGYLLLFDEMGVMQLYRVTFGSGACKRFKDYILGLRSEYILKPRVILNPTFFPNFLLEESLIEVAINTIGDHLKKSEILTPMRKLGFQI